MEENKEEVDPVAEPGEENQEEIPDAEEAQVENGSPAHNVVNDDADADPDAGPALIEGADGLPFGEEEEKQNANVSPEVFENIKTLFEVFDEEGTGYVDINELFVIMKALDVKPLEEEEEDLLRKADPNDEGAFTMDGLLSIMEEKLKPTDTVEDLVEQLNILNKRKDGGTIATPELKQFLTTMGMKFSEEEAEALIKEADPKNDGVVSIDAFAIKMCPVPKEPKS
ncbi:unnamed protein product [Moneuplotes crassus]|uniref:Calmodulin n=1 Tax=Euplotes crassus TaxID=5936 RepID=A0AAD2D4U4_EUPCR|nr:unnamed protein product [Moneuplotes crassus]